MSMRDDPNFKLVTNIINGLGDCKKERLFTSIGNRNDVIGLFSMCTGANMMTAQAGLLGRAVAMSQKRKVSVVDLGICEKIESKSKFSMHVADKAGRKEDRCNYDELCNLADGHSKCRQHSESCPLPTTQSYAD